MEWKCIYHIHLRQNKVEKNMRAPPKKIFTPLCGQGPEAQRAREGRARARAKYPGKKHFSRQNTL